MPGRGFHEKAPSCQPIISIFVRAGSQGQSPRCLTGGSLPDIKAGASRLLTSLHWPPFPDVQRVFRNGTRSGQGRNAVAGEIFPLLEDFSSHTPLTARIRSVYSL